MAHHLIINIHNIEVLDMPYDLQWIQQCQKNYDVKTENTVFGVHGNVQHLFNSLHCLTTIFKGNLCAAVIKNT